MIHPDIVTAYRDHAGGLHERESMGLWENHKEAQRLLRQATYKVTGAPHLDVVSDAEGEEWFNEVFDAAHRARQTWLGYRAAHRREAEAAEKEAAETTS